MIKLVKLNLDVLSVRSIYSYKVLQKIIIQYFIKQYLSIFKFFFKFIQEFYYSIIIKVKQMFRFIPYVHKNFKPFMFLKILFFLELSLSKR